VRIGSGLSHQLAANLRLTSSSRCPASGPFAILQWSPVSQASPIFSLQKLVGIDGAQVESPPRAGVELRSHEERVDIFHIRKSNEPPRRCAWRSVGLLQSRRKTCACDRRPPIEFLDRGSIRNTEYVPWYRNPSPGTVAT